jgi:hypothetical protein
MSASTWSGSSFRWSGLHFQRHMAVAQVVGGAQQSNQRRAVFGAGAHVEHRLRRGLHRDQAAVLRPPAHRRRAPRWHAWAGTRRARGPGCRSRRSGSSAARPSPAPQLAARLSNTAARPRTCGGRSLWWLSMVNVSLVKSAIRLRMVQQRPA